MLVVVVVVGVVGHNSTDVKLCLKQLVFPTYICLLHLPPVCHLLADSDRQTGSQRGAGDPAQSPPGCSFSMSTGAGANDSNGNDHTGIIALPALFRPIAC